MVIGYLRLYLYGHLLLAIRMHPINSNRFSSTTGWCEQSGTPPQTGASKLISAKRGWLPTIQFEDSDDYVSINLA